MAVHGTHTVEGQAGDCKLLMELLDMVAADRLELDVLE